MNYFGLKNSNYILNLIFLLLNQDYNFYVCVHVCMYVIHPVVRLALPQRIRHALRASASSFNFQYPSFSFKSSSSCLRLLPYLAVTYILPSMFPSITCFIRQFLRKMWPIQLAFLLLYVRWSCLPWLYVILLHCMYVHIHMYNLALLYRYSKVNLSPLPQRSVVTYATVALSTLKVYWQWTFLYEAMSVTDGSSQ